MLRTVLSWIALAALALTVKHWFVDRYFPTMPLNYLIWLPIAIVFWIVATIGAIGFVALKDKFTPRN